MSRSKSSRPPRNSAERKGRKTPQENRGAGNPSKKSSGGDIWFYGDHAVFACLANEKRRLKRLLMTKAKFTELDDETKGMIEERLAPEIVSREAIDALVGEQAVHQGVALLPSPLPEMAIEDLPGADDPAPLVVALLDQVTDPHNVGAILRSAAAFGVAGLIMPDRHSPQATGVLAKSASGALETVPLIRVSNLSRALDQLAEKGFWRIGLDGYADQDLETIAKGQRKVALVLGSEGKGLRALTAQKCDFLARLPISGQIESLNVSNAAAIAFYEISRQLKSL
ncbi:MAG: 23S rRNA (guanosine(2251)-2'-O)-methyltransferase RlmB [Alphaproteobacteria bacterium]|nr:MAG: 23S rRNA (guanosine(2251)-2'-O)-methyltransferase RlmB [Alphaproteobacteria bacterium]